MRLLYFLTFAQEGEIRHREVFWLAPGPSREPTAKLRTNPGTPVSSLVSGKHHLLFWAASCLSSYPKLCVSVDLWAEGRGFLWNTFRCRFPSLSVWISHRLHLPFRPHSLPPFSRQQCWSLSSWLSCCTLIFNRPLLLLHLVCGLWTLCGSAAGNSEWVGNLKQKRLCISTGLRFELCSALDACSWFSGLWFKCSFAGVSVKPKSVLKNW